MISIIYNLWNRSSVKFHYDWDDQDYNLKLFPNSYKSLLASISQTHSHKELYEIIIVDWGQDDIDLKSYINRFEYPKNVKVKIKPIVGEYNTSRGKNYGASHAKGEWLLFIDVDMILPESFVDRILFMINEGVSAYFPHCRYGKNPDNTIKSHFIENAFGNMLIRKQIFDKIKFKDKEALKHREDNAMYEWLRIVPGRFIIKEDCMEGLLHQYHPRMRR